MSQEYRYLLDTDILSCLIRHPQGAVRDCIAQVGEERVCTSVVVAGELRFGAMKRGSSRLTERVETVLSALNIFPLEPAASIRYASLRQGLERQGSVIGPNDMWIAAHALSLELTLVSANTKEFTRVPDLQLENWLS